MDIEGIGIDICGMGQVNKLIDIERNLQLLFDMGYRVVEFAMELQNLVINGELRRKEFENLKSVLNNFDIQYTVHGYLRLNLAYDGRTDLCNKILSSHLEFCKGISANRLVIHSGLEALTTLRQGVRRSLLSDEELRHGALNEVNALKKAAPKAGDFGIIICVENGDPHLWEINTLLEFGGKEKDLAKFHQRLMIPPIIKQLELVDHPAVGMTLDFGHLYIASKTLHFDYISAVKEAVPWVKHLHLSDNFGNLDRNVNNESERWAFGEADMHMPPGWGAIPFPEVIACFSNYHGYAILEINEGFRDYFIQALDDTKQLFNYKNEHSEF